jgi:Tol biopolymer transport system component
VVGEDGALRTLEDMPVQGRSPAWSPDGSRLAFESDRGNDEGRYAAHPAWSPDGRRMVFDAKDPKGDHVFGIAIIDAPVAQ